VDEICIAFYGGESFLEIDNIKACVAYVREKYPRRPVRYTVTTNGTLFNDDIIRFLEENNFSTAISFDGPRELHDKNRLYADGKGSFDDIMKNVRYIREHFPAYYSHISFMTVVAPGTDFSCVNDFFSANDVLAASYSLVNNFGANENIEYDDLYSAAYNYQMTKVLLSVIGLYSTEKQSKLLGPSLALIELFHSGLSQTTIPEKSHPGGPCIPGSMRPFVDIYGNIYPCERVSENSDAMLIGHIDSGFYMEKVNAILNVGNLSDDECKVCWNFIHCGLCAAACDDGTRLCKEERLKHCSGRMHDTLNNLVTICFLRENKYDFIKLPKE